MRYTFGWDMFVVSINARPKWPFLLILIVYGPCVAILNCLGQVCIWVELPIQRRLCPIFVSGVGLPGIHEYSAG